MATQEKIVVFRRVWKEGKGKYCIRLPEKIVKYYGLEGKFVKGTLEIIEDDNKNTTET